jgi:hypothetical protein
MYIEGVGVWIGCAKQVWVGCANEAKLNGYMDE